MGILYKKMRREVEDVEIFYDKYFRERRVINLVFFFWYKLNLEIYSKILVISFG